MNFRRQSTCRRGICVSLAVAVVISAAVAGTDERPASDALPTSLYQALAWRNIGPFRGGRAVAVTGVESDPKVFYFGGVGGGIFKTINGGESWFNVSDGFFKLSSVGAIAVAQSDPNVIYVGMGEHTIRGTTLSHGDGIYRSTDAGKTWRHLGLDATRATSRIVVHPSNPELVYVAAQGTPYVPSSDRGVYRSKDGGATWQKVLFVNDTTGPADLAMDPRNPRILFVAMWDHQRKPWDLRSGGPGSAIYKSIDAGDTWQKIVNGLPPVMGRIGIVVSADSQRLYALVECDPKGGLYRSDDAGGTWTLVNEAWNQRTRPWYYMRVAADPRDPNVVWAINATLLKSIDAGRTFRPVAGPHGDHHDLWINAADPQTMILGDDGGATISRNGGLTWLPESNQPTAQFYRVNTDDQFPYHVYGGQQDNTTVSIASATEGQGLLGSGGGISERDWYAVGGCESGFVALNKRDPRFVYAGCWGGQITEYDQQTRYSSPIMAYPRQEFGGPIGAFKYRFNYNAPIVVSQHDPHVLYHAGQKLLRSDDRGRSWREISPDLTNARPETQGVGGGPFWPEGEIYDTITYVAESPHDPKVMWTGSDDGVIGLTRDGGANWKRMALPQLADALINEIEVSPYDPGTAYVAASRYKFNDYRPELFKTTNFGETWERISEGIPDGSWTRVVRVDPVRKGLLYCGTETGAFVSFDDGKRWQSLQLNLPVTPVTDLQVHDTDLVASTQGRAFWILDDITPLREVDAAVAGSAAHLFQPRPAIRTTVGSAQLPSPSTTQPNVQGTNAPRGAILDFWIAQPSSVTIEIADANGAVVRRIASGPGAGGLRLKAGLNRILWDLRRDPGPRIGGAGAGPFRVSGRWIKPGKYQVRLQTAGQSFNAPLEVRMDPRVEPSAEDFNQQDELLVQIESTLSDLHRTVDASRSVRTQLTALTERTHDAALAASAKKLADALLTQESALVQSESLDMQRFVVEPSRTADLLASLHSNVNQVLPVVTKGQRDVYADLIAEWQKHKQEMSRLLGPELDNFNESVRQRNIPAVTRPQ